MTDVTDFDKEQSEIQDEFLNSNIEEGKLIEGKVVLIQDGYVFIDVNYKSEPKIAVKDFDVVPKIGDSIKVVVEKIENKNGEMIVSKNKADELNFKQNSKAGHLVDGVFAKEVKGGVEVKIIGEEKGFCPLSQIDVNKVENVADWIGKKAKFRIEKNDRQGRNIILSRRAYLEEEINKKRDEFLATKHVGDVVEGCVKNFTSYGAFIDLGGFDGLLHLSDLSWGHVASPRNLIEKDKKIELKIVNIDPETKKINLSLKDMTENPWNSVGTEFYIDQVVKGKVTKITEFGIFVKLKDGIEGLAHISELSWVKHVKHPKELFSVGDEIEVKILNIDFDNKKISLGVKQLLPNIWETFEEKYPQGCKVNGTITNILNNGLIVEIEENVEGFLYIDNISWERKSIDLKGTYKIGDKIDVCLLNFDRRAKKISLGVKQLTSNPWEDFSAKYRRRSIVDCVITKIGEKGFNAKVVGTEIEGFIPLNYLVDRRDIENVNLKEEAKKYSVDQQIKAAIYDLNINERKLILSVSLIQEIEQKEEISKYLYNQNDDEKSSLADFMKK